MLDHYCVHHGDPKSFRELRCWGLNSHYIMNQRSNVGLARDRSRVESRTYSKRYRKEQRKELVKTIQEHREKFKKIVVEGKKVIDRKKL
jgi:hypothetical protein